MQPGQSRHDPRCGDGPVSLADRFFRGLIGGWHLGHAVITLVAAIRGPHQDLDTAAQVAHRRFRNSQRKLERCKHVTVRHQDVLYLRDETFDVVCCYFLMHELPDDYKRGVAATLLDCVRPGGKLVFVDYHKPHWAHPLKLITSFVFDTLEPYAKGLWRDEIASFAGNDERFTWRKETYFGGLFQKVVATRGEL